MSHNGTAVYFRRHSAHESTYLSICNKLNKVLKLWHTDKPLLLYRCGYSQLIFTDMNFSIKRDDLIEWLNVVNKSLITDGWEFAGFHNRDYNMIKIRKKYSEDEIQINEDGFKYKSLYPNEMNTKDYLFFKSKGYPVEVSF